MVACADRFLAKGPVAAIVALPLVLPPTVLGFYLLMAMSPTGPVGRLTESLSLGTLPFTFWGLVVGSCATHCRSLCSHCRMRLQPSGNGHGDGRNPSGGCLGSVFPYCSADGVARVYLCQCIGLCAYARGIWSGANDWGQYSWRNRVVSVQIYDHVEALDYAQAHWLAGGMIVFSFLILLLLYLSSDKAAVGSLQLRS